MSSGEERIRPRDDLALMPGYHSPQLDVTYRMNTNEAPEAPPEEFVAALKEAIGAVSFNRYPDLAADALRSAVASFHGVPANEVYCANGSNEVLQALLLAFGGAGRSVAVFEPTYALHSHIARITGTAVITGERDDAFFVSESEFERVMQAGNPAVTFLCSPNNPTGRVEPPEVIEMVLAGAPGLVVVDEAYGQFAPRSALELRSDHPNLVVIRTFSKTWSLAALRLGYCIAHPKVVEALEAVTLPYHLDAMKQVAGRLALEYSDEMRARVSRLVEERGRLVAALQALPLTVCPSDANFILFRVDAEDAHKVWQALVDESILVRDVSSWPRLEGYLRVTIGTRAENDAFLVSLAKALG